MHVLTKCSFILLLLLFNKDAIGAVLTNSSKGHNVHIHTHTLSHTLAATHYTAAYNTGVNAGVCGELKSRKAPDDGKLGPLALSMFRQKMTELGQCWPTQAWLMRDELSKHRCLGQEWRRLSETAEKTVSCSFLCL